MDTPWCVPTLLILSNCRVMPWHDLTYIHSKWVIFIKILFQNDEEEI